MDKKHPGGMRYSKGQCAHCGAVTEVKEYHNLDCSRDPDVKGLLMSEERFFEWKCPECGMKGFFSYPCWYFDPEKGLGIALIPNIDSTTGDRALQRMNANLRGLARPGITHRAVGNFLAMQEQIAAREYGLDDRTVQLAKPLIIGQLQSEGKQVWNGYFVQILEDTGGEPIPGVLYMSPAGTEPDYSKPVYCYNVYLTDYTPLAVGVNEHAFRLCQEQLELSGAQPDSGEFQLYDLNWAIDFYNGGEEQDV